MQPIAPMDLFRNRARQGKCMNPPVSTRQSSGKPHLTSLAVIVSTYNQPQHLARCLFALGRQYQSPFEIPVADDGSGAGHF